MKKLLTIFLLLPLTLLGQNQTPLQPFTEVMKFESLMTSLKSYSYSNGKRNIFEFKNFPEVIDVYLNNSGTENSKNNALLKKYKDNIRKYCEEITDVVGYDLPDSSSSKFKNLPLGFATFNNFPIFYQSGLLYEKNINTVRLSGEERLKYVLKNVSIPFLDHFRTLTEVTEIKHFGLIYSYIAKDFTDDYATPHGETVVIVVPKETLNKYFNLEITSEDIIESSTFYGLTERGDLKKISIK